MTLHKSELASLRSLHRVYLIKSIHHRDFEKVREWIQDNPLEEMDEYFKRLRQRNELPFTSHDEDGQPVHPDSLVRRGQVTPKKTRFTDGTSPKSDGSKYSKWNIPPLPTGWKSCIPNGLAKIIEKWRSTANGTTMSPHLLEKKFAMRKVIVDVPKGKRNRRTTDEDTGADPAPGDTTKRARIMLAYPKMRRLRNGGQSEQSQICSEYDLN